MSLIYSEKLAISKRSSTRHVNGVYKTKLNAALIGIFSVLGVISVSHAQNVPLTLDQTVVKSTEAIKIDPTASQDRDLRSKAMKEAAQSYGARSGLARRSFEIRSTLETAAGQNDAIWNFRPLMLTDAQPGEAPGTLRQRLIVPPIIVQASSVFHQKNAGTIQLVDNTYKLFSQPRFSSVTPTWRDYLFRDLGEVEVSPPHVSLLPRTDEERKKWDQWIAEGWKSGVNQANNYYEYDLNRLHRDFDGMVTYHELVAKKIVSLPYVATSNAPISGDDNTLNINDSLLRITVMPAFNHDSKTWQALQSGK